MAEGWLGISDSTLLSFAFLVTEMGIISTLENFYKDQRYHKDQTVSIVLFIK